jgi:hypothetical protein
MVRRWLERSRGNRWREIMSTTIDEKKRLVLVGLASVLLPGCASLREKKCAICGEPAVGWCHMRNIHVCERHRYFTRDGQNWRCP